MVKLLGTNPVMADLPLPKIQAANAKAQRNILCAQVDEGGEWSVLEEKEEEQSFKPEADVDMVLATSFS